MPYGVIYLLRCTSNGKGYVGQTTRSLKVRWQEHQKQGNCRLLTYAIRKYGIQNFELTEMDQAESQDDLDLKERAWIDRLSTRVPKGYNLREGGYGGKPSLETRRLQSLAGRGKPKSDEHRQRIGLANKGKKRSAESCENNRRAQIGRKRDPASIAKSKEGYRKTHLRKAALGEIRAVLKESDVLTILRLCHQGSPQMRVAKQYNVTRSTIQHITHGRRWKHLYAIFQAEVACSNVPLASATNVGL